MPYYGPSMTTLLFNGTDLQTLTGITVTDFSGLVSPMQRKGDFDSIPRRRGVLGVSRVLDAYTFPVPILVDGDTEAEMWTNLMAAWDVLKGTGGGGLGTLERRLDDDGSGGSYTSYTARGAVLSLGWDLLNRETGQTEITFENLDGAWKNAADQWVP
jgi:hypothetical protein